MKIIYIQDDRSYGVHVQFCYSQDMQMLDRWATSVYGEYNETFHNTWEREYPDSAMGVRNLRTSDLKLEDFISMCETLGYTVKRVINQLFKGDSFKESCIKMYPEDFQ